jgi:co-chaperonin GroES (HSP10)
MSNVLDLSICPHAAGACLPKITSVTPCGSSILVELLTKEEMNSLVSSVLHLGASSAASEGAQQGYILAIGPGLTESALKVGNRVLLTNYHGQGFVPVPNLDGSKRTRGIVELHNIKAVLEEESVLA